MEKVNLTKETIDDLATEICKRLLQAGEKLLKEGEEAGLLGLLLKDHLERIEKRQAKEEKERDRARKVDAILKHRDSPIFPMDPIDNANRETFDTAKLNRQRQINRRI